MDDIERAKEKTFSRQPRFNEGTQALFASMHQWVKVADLEAPPYSVRSRTRDGWLRNFWMREPHWAFAVSQATMIDANRRWTLTGGRNQVYRYMSILHDAEDGLGWRHYIKKQAKSFRVTDMGAVTEIGREGDGGPLRGVYHVDSARCELTGNIDMPLAYYPPGRKRQDWGPDDFIRTVSSPSDDEAMRGLGWCATSMALELTKLLYAVLMHDQELTMARMPKGLLLFGGIDEIQFTQALEARDEDLDARNRAYFGGIIALFSAGLEQNPSAQLIALSQLPAGFNRETFINQTLYAYAAILGLDPSEIWPVQFGALGRGTETEVQHRKATTKGVYDFTLAHQEQLQRYLPNTLQFEYEQRDAAGELGDATVAQAWADVAKTLYEAGQAYAVPLLEREKALSLLAEHNIIPPEWTEMEEDVKATDADTEERSIKRLRERAMESPYVQRALVEFNEPIVRYMWPEQRLMTLWEPGPHLWPVMRGEVKDFALLGYVLGEMEKDVICGKRLTDVRFGGGRWNGLVDVPQATFNYALENGLIERTDLAENAFGVAFRITRKGRGFLARADDDTLYSDGGFSITMEDVDKAVSAARRRQGVEMTALLEAQELE